MSESQLPVYVPAPRVLAQEVHGEIVLLDLDSQRYFGLNEVGARVWQLIASGAEPGAIVETLELEFEVERFELEADVQRLLGELTSAGLLRTTGG